MRSAIGLVGAYLPILLLKNRIIKRQQSIRRAWPDCLDLLLLCVEAGMSIEVAFKRVAKEMGEQSPALAEEMTLTTAELAFLEDRSRAYDNLGKRTGLDGVKSVMTALIQADRYGTAVGTALRVMAEEGREQRMMEAEKKAAALPPKLTVPLIVFFLPVLFIVIISPALIRVFSQGVVAQLGVGPIADAKAKGPSGPFFIAAIGTDRDLALVALDHLPAVLLGEQGADIGHVRLDLVRRQLRGEQRLGFVEAALEADDQREVLPDLARRARASAPPGAGAPRPRRARWSSRRRARDWPRAMPRSARSSAPACRPAAPLRCGPSGRGSRP